MSYYSSIYRFNEFEVDAEEEILFRQGKPVKLEPKAFQVLLLLVKNAGQTVTREKFLDDIWIETSVTPSGIDVQISKLRKALGPGNSYIETVARKGYRFVQPVKKSRKQKSFLVTEVVRSEQTTENKDGNDAPAIPIRSNNHIYFSLVSTCYGMLFGIGILLEGAYEFDKFGWSIAKIAPLVILLNFGAMFFGLTIIKRTISKSMSRAFIYGVIFLFLGATLSCLMASAVLPNEPITVANFQTQPALAAYIKNVFIYFVPFIRFLYF